MSYEKLVNELKKKSFTNKISFKKIIQLINNYEYDEIILMDKNKEINFIINEKNLIENIIQERENIANNLEKKLINLIWLNEILVKFGEEKQSSSTKARKLLKSKVFINIYDLESEKYENNKTKELLKKQLRKNPHMRFPLKCAKGSPTLKLFLIKI